MSDLEQGYPFLVARGRRRGFRTILAPEFMIRDRLHGLLSEAGGAGSNGAAGPRAFELDRPGLGRMTIVETTEQMTDAELGGVALDEHGRPLKIRYGIVRRGRAGMPGRDAMLRARAAALESYLDFLADEERFDVDVSSPLGVVADPPVPDVPEPDEPPRRPTHARRIVVVVVGALIAVVLAVVLLGGRAKPCTVAAAVAVGANTAVVYEWDPPLGEPVRAASPPDGILRVRTAITGDRADSYVLVVDGTQRSAPVRPECG